MRHKDTQFKGDYGQSFDIDLKTVSDDGEFEGYASVYGNVDRGGDIVKSGAFRDSLKVRPIEKVKMLYQHHTGDLIGVWKKAKSDSTGLHVTGNLLLKTQKGAEAYELLKAGALDSMSIGYRIVEDAWDRNTDVRTIVKAELLEISLVTFPMNESALVNSVKAAANIKTIREFETFLRDVGGFSHAAAKAIASGGYKELEPRDEDGSDGVSKSDLQRLTQMMRGGSN